LDFLSFWQPVAHKSVTYEGAPEVARKSYLIPRNGRWYYNRAYPKSLWAVVGRSTFRIALGTSSLDEAQRQRGFAEQRYWAAVDEARHKLETVRPRQLSESEAVAIVSRWFAQRNRELDHDHLHDPTPAEGWKDAVAGNVFTVAYTTDRLGTNQIDAFAPLAARVLEAEGVEADTRSPAYRTLLQLLVRANKELAAIDLARLKGDFGYKPSDPMMLAALDAPATRQHTVADLIREYQASKEQKRRWSQSTITAHKPVYRLLRETFGDTRELRTIAREDGRHLFNMIVGMPMNLGKKKELEGLTVPQAVEKARALGLPTIGPKTINGSYVTFVKAMFKWAVTEGWMGRNPLDGDFRVADDVAEHEKRDAFQPQQLKVLFSASPWDGSYDRMGPKAGKFWIPLLCLFHGLRLGEAAGMHVEDITEREGYPVFHLRAFDGRSSKTKGSRGLLPIHPELIRIGFLGYVEQRRRAKAVGLFPDVSTSKNGKVGAKTGEWFARLVREHGLVGTKLTMHSFRHSFEDRLREDEVPERTALALSRRTERGSRGVYGDGLSVASRARWMATLAYPELDLTHLHVREAHCEPVE
jgi:integrase